MSSDSTCVFGALVAWCSEPGHAATDGCPPIVLARATGLTKQQVNRALYNDLKTRVQKVQDVPPRWRPRIENNQRQDEAQQQEQRREKDEGDIHIFIDLGNVHDCLPEAVKLAEAYTREPDGPRIHVHAYADWGYNGSEGPACEHYIWRAPHAGKHAADVAMVLEVGRLVDRVSMTEQIRQIPDTQLHSTLLMAPIVHLILASRDKFVTALAEHLRNAHPNTVPHIDIVTNWQEMRCLIEY